MHFLAIRRYTSLVGKAVPCREIPWWVWCRGKPHPALGPASFSSMVPPLKDGADGNRTRPCLLLQLGPAAQGRCMAVRRQSPQAGRNLEAHTAAATPFLSPTPPVAQNRDSASSLYNRRCPPILRQGEGENVTQIVLHAPPPRLACVVSATPTPSSRPLSCPLRTPPANTPPHTRHSTRGKSGC